MTNHSQHMRVTVRKHWRLVAVFSVMLLAGCGENAETDDAAAESDDRASAPEPAPHIVAASIPTAAKPSSPLEEGVSCVTDACHAFMASSISIHPTVRSGECTVCHEADTGEHIYPLKTESSTLCRECHEIGGNAVVQHMGAAGANCIACHEPHASDAPHQLRETSIAALCSQCHIAERGAVAHEPFGAGACMSCHEPHESDHAGLLRGGVGAEHCFSCHDETRRAIEEAPFVHDPAAGDCTVCHDPHASDHAHVLHQPVEQGCFACHEDIEQAVHGASSPHGAVFTGERCATCHDAHASGRNHLIRDREDALCLQCHDEELKSSDGRVIADIGDTVTDRTFLHGPIKNGECSPCHNVHGASHSRLLRERFTEAFYAPFDLQDYALCFDCHVQDLVVDERTSALTDFRIGDRNLHFVHVNQNRKGRTCRTCHEIHGGDTPRHIADSVPFEGSGWALPIRFSKLEDGGSCSPGCHVPRTYRRGPSNEETPPSSEGGAS